MNLEETVTLIECLRESGATHFKSRDLEVFFGIQAKRQVPRSPQVHRESAPKEEAQETPKQGANAEATAKAEELIRTLRNPEKLIDAIFPDGANGI